MLTVKQAWLCWEDIKVPFPHADDCTYTNNFPDGVHIGGCDCGVWQAIQDKQRAWEQLRTLVMREVE